MAAKKASKSAAKPARAASRPSFTIGLDLGGTKIAAGLVDERGRVRAEAIKPTHPSGLTPAARDAVNKEIPPNEHVKFVVSSMADQVEDLLDRAPGASRSQKIASVGGVGLASAGPMNVLQGRLLNPANFAGWKDVRVRSLLERELARRGLRFPIAFQNDAVAAALGEGWTGAAKGCRTYAMITLGTGVGTGVILDGKPAQFDGMGSEWGHMILNAAGIADAPEAYETRTAEGLCSGTGILRRARSRGHVGASVNKLADACREGDQEAQRVFDEAGEGLACLFFNLSLGFRCQKIVVGGGLLHIKELFLPRALALYERMIGARNSAFRAKIAVAKLANGAGVVGAARLAREG